MPEDVNPADPSAAVAPEPVVDTGGPAPGDVAPVQGDDRPVQNVVAEFNRKMAKLQNQYDTLVQYVAAQAQSRPAQPVKGDPTDDELWSLAQQGDRGAFEVYMRRIADRSGQTQVRAFEQQRLVDTQLAVLANRYAVLNDASHPLTQQVNTTYTALVSQGYPANRATMLEALKTAIADRPDLVTEIHMKTQPATLRRDRAQAGVTGATTRDEPPAPRPKQVSKEETDLARRMGVSDPAKAKERFAKRQDQGQSSLGAVAIHIKED